jgi:SAM-dependent methyltransferase
VGASLSDFEEHDYSALWLDKQLEDSAQKHIIRNWLGGGESCLELGGGYGRLTGLLESRFPQMTMLEFANRNIAMAKRRLSRTRIIRADAAHIPVRSDVFDCAVMVRVVHLLPDPAKVMREVYRVVKNQGTVIISVPNLQMNRLSWEFKGRLLPKGLRNRSQTYGTAAWPYDERPHFLPHRGFVPASFKPRGRKGTGLFDNYVGKMLGRFKSLYLIDVVTSPFWFFKFDIFLRFEVRKVG